MDGAAPSHSRARRGGRRRLVLVEVVVVTSVLTACSHLATRSRVVGVDSGLPFAGDAGRPGVAHATPDAARAALDELSLRVAACADHDAAVGWPWPRAPGWEPAVAALLALDLYARGAAGPARAVLRHATKEAGDSAGDAASVTSASGSRGPPHGRRERASSAAVAAITNPLNTDAVCDLLFGDVDAPFWAAASALADRSVACGAARARPRILFAMHNLLMEGSSLVATTWIEYMLRVLRLQVWVQAPPGSCGQPLAARLRGAGATVECGPRLAPDGFDAVYINTIVSWFEPPGDDAWLARTIWWVHESTRREYFPQFPLTPRLLPRAALRVFVSNANRAAYADLGSPRDVVVYNAAPRWRVTGPAARADREAVLGAAPGDVVFIMLGTFNGDRHQDDFVRAGLRVLGAGAGGARARFALVGLTGENPAAEARVRALVDGSRFADRFALLPKVDHERALAALAAADVVVSVSDHESFGMTILEGMAAGLPVVAHKVDGVPEVAYAGAADVDPGDEAAFAAALAGLLPGEARASHARAALDRARFFDGRTFYARHALALSSVLGGAAGGGGGSASRGDHAAER